ADVVAVAAGSSHSVALKADGSVWTWGNNLAGQLGDGTTIERHTPTRVTRIADVVTIAANGFGPAGAHTVVLRADGTVWAWGENRNGELGDGTTIERHTPVQVLGLTGVASIATGVDHTLAIKTDGTVWAWGDNINGQLGDGTFTDRHAPVQVQGLSGVIAV